MSEDKLVVCCCKRKTCPRHGSCAECIKHHEGKKYPPYCQRESLKKAAKRPK